MHKTNIFPFNYKTFIGYTKNNTSLDINLNLKTCICNQISLLSGYLCINQFHLCPAPPGNRGAFASLVSPGGGALANLARPGDRTLAHPGEPPGF